MTKSGLVVERMLCDSVAPGPNIAVRLKMLLSKTHPGMSSSPVLARLYTVPSKVLLTIVTSVLDGFILSA